MKLAWISVVGGFLLHSTGFAQSGGDLIFANDSQSRIANTLTGTFVRNTDSIAAMLYMAPAGTTNEDALIPVTQGVQVGRIPVAFGLYAYPTNPLTIYGMPREVVIQVRAFETNYGANYEQAVAAPAANGRRALVGKSAMALLTLGIGGTPPQETRICGPFSVDIAGGGPYLTVGDLVVAEGSNGTATANFKVSLASTQAQTVTVDFATVDGSATAGADYVATSGTITFVPGEILKTVAVTLTPDAMPESDEEFYLDLSNVSNALLVKNRARCVITEIRITNLSVDTAISFNTVASRRYAVERTSDMATWQTVAGATNVLGTGSVVTVIDHGNGCATSVLYRARLIEP